MDSPCPHITSDVALRSALADFSAHPKLPLPTTAYLALRHREARERGHTAMADALLRLAESRAAADLVRELGRRVRDRGRRHFCGFRQHPTVVVALWRNPDTRPELRRLMREYLATRPSGFSWRQMRAGLEWVTAHERDHREFLMAFLLEWLAEVATRPDEPTRRKIAAHMNEVAGERHAAELLRAGGLPDKAAAAEAQADFHLWRAQNLAREWTPNAHALIREVRCGALSWQLGGLGYETTAKLVEAALNRRVTRKMARYAFKTSPR